MVFHIDDTVVMSNDCDLVVVFHDGKLVTSDAPIEGLGSSRCLFTLGQLPSLVLRSTNAGMLSIGKYLGRRVSLVEMGVDTEVPLQDNLVYTPVREFISGSSAVDANIVNRAAQIANWRATHRFCSRCGTPTTLHLHDRAYTCASCEFLMYPRISPCVIGIVVNGDKLLLARASKSTKPIYSAIAGFVEAGETPEQALAREVLEEVGVAVRNIEYIQSQAWPFPGQLMLGFLAEYESGDISIDEREIAHADWFYKDNLPMLPPPFAISAKLIEHALERME